VTASTAEVFLELLVLYAALVPLGLVLLRAVERFRGRTFALTSLERGLLAPYLAVALLFVLASLQLPIYSAGTVILILAAGAAGMLLLWLREGGRTPRAALRSLRSPVGLAVGLGSLGILALEVISTGTHSFPNAYDGSFQSLYIQLLVTHHHVAWTLEPYANAGVIYPQGATVWLSLPVLLFGWSIPSAPVGLPPLFLSLSVPAAFCWGERLGGVRSGRGTAWGLLFAAFFGLVASWTRLFVGGSYDFAFGFPLFLLALGWLRPFVTGAVRDWRNVVVFGGLLGVLTSLSLALGESLVLLWLASWIVWGGSSGLPLRSGLARAVAVLAIGGAFVAQSLVGVAVWYHYPAHVLSAIGNPPSTPIAGLPQASLASLGGEVNPFVFLKPKMSPLPILSVELTVLLSVGLVLAALWILRGPQSRWRRWLPIDALLPILLGTLVFLLWTALLVAGSGPGSVAGVFDSLASLYEASILLFIFYQAVALLPLVVLVEIGRERWGGSPGAERSNSVTPVPSDRPRRQRAAPLTPRRWVTVAVAIALAAPLLVGASVTVVQGPDYLAAHLAMLSNVTPDDVQALEWAGANLPSCSVVLVAPGSAGQFLPVYGEVHLDFPMMPLSENLSYNISTWDLIQGIYNGSTRAALLSLGVTEVFVSGRTSVTYLPLDPAPMESSPDFSSLFARGDAYVFGFDPGISAGGCPP
jgi:hypothetical protein